MPAKDTATFWKSKITKRTIQGEPSANYYARMSHAGRRAWINLETGNTTTAANTAAKKYTLLKTKGWEALKPAKHKGDIMTVGEWIKAVESLRKLRTSTLLSYVRKLRQIASEIKGIGDTHRFSAKGGSAAWTERVDKIKLSELTDERVKKWRARRLQAIKGKDEATAKRAINTANSILRNAKAIFGKKILEQVDVEFSKIPFTGVSIEESDITPFQPEVNLDTLIAVAAEELDEDLHLVFMLAAGCGLRRSEIDRLRRQDVDLDKCTLKVASTNDGEVKSKRSVRTLNFTEGGPVHEALKNSRLGFHVVCPENPRPTRKAENYRCDEQFKELAAWLRSQGIVKAIQPIHYLRKAFGDRVASLHGVDIAAMSLGDSIEITYKVYSSHNKTKAIM